MDINELLRREFLNEWRSLTERNIDYYLSDVQDAFSLYTMRRSINESIDTSRDKNLMERYHRNSISILARLYARTLYELSDNGRNVNSSIITEAKREMKGKKECEAYPC